MNNLLHKPWFFAVSVIVVLLLSLWTWSAFHGGQPFVSARKPWAANMRQMRWTRDVGSRNQRNFGSGMQRNFSGENTMSSWWMWRPRLNENTTGELQIVAPQ